MRFRVLARPRWSWIALAVFLAVLAGLAADIDWRAGRWHATLQQVRFVDHQEKISAADAAVTVTGYLVATIESDVDFFALANEDAAHPGVEASLCDTHQPLGAWPDPLPNEPGPGARPFSYAVLIPMRGRAVDLSKTGENVCVRFRAEALAPLSWVKSRPVVVPIDDMLRLQLVRYEQRGGGVQLALDPGCAPRLCEPHFSPDALKP